MIGKVGEQLTRARQAARFAFKLLGSAPALVRELEQARLQLERSRRDLLRERRRTRRVEQRIRGRRRNLVQEKKRLEQREQRLKVRRQQFKRTVREYLLQRMPEKSVCAEVGVHEGEFSRQILDVAEPRLLHLIDPWEHSDEHTESLYGGLGPQGQRAMDERYRRVREAFSEEIESGKVKIHRNLSAAAAEEFGDSYFDWVYIDGNHLYEFVMQDLELYCSKVKPGGYIAGDDYGVKGWWGNGVQEAVNEFVEQRPDLALEVVHRQFIIKVP